MKFAQMGRNSPEIFEGEPQLRGFARFARKNIYCAVGCDHHLGRMYSSVQKYTNQHNSFDYPLTEFPGNWHKKLKGIQ
jgi:hypothetical protein